MESPRSFVVENLTAVRHREGFEEMAGVSNGQPVSVGVTHAGQLKNEAQSQTFAAEVRKTFALNHPALAKNLAVEPAGALQWAVAWERFEGLTLDKVIAERGALLPDDAVSLTLTLAQAVQHAHGRDLVHGNLSAEWVVLLSQPMPMEVRLAGFGLGLLPAFSSGKKPAAVVDVAGLGSILHLLLIGKPPDGAQIGTIPAQAIHLGAVLAKSLGLDLSNRYRNVQEFIEALSEANRTRVSGGHVVPGSNSNLTPVGVRTLGPWELQELIGEGAMGQVFLAKHTLLGRQAAIKVLRPEQYQREDLIQRFFQEARSVNQINHEHIVEISDFGQELGPDGKPTAVYFVMELLQGETLSSRLAKGTLNIERSVHVVKQLASALEAAHKLGVVHRDVKTDNVFLVSRHGDAEYVKVLDFGVAKLTQVGTDAPKVSTMDGAIIGTPTSMSPEQASGGVVDARADIYAVGVLLYQLLSGKLPIDADNFGKIVALLLTKVPDPLPERTPNGEPIPPWLADVVRRCLEKEPNKRPQSMGELIKALSSPVATQRSVARTEMVYPADVQKPPPSRRGLVIGLTLGVLIAGGAGVSMFWSGPLPVVPLPDAGLEVAVVDAGPAVAPDAGLALVEVPDAGEAEEPDAGEELAEVDAGVMRDAGVVKVVKVKPVQLTKAIVQGVIVNQLSPRLNACATRFQASLPASGTFPVTFSIEKSGATSGISAGGDYPKPVKACLEKAVAGIRFPPNLTGSTAPITYNAPFARQ